MRSSVVPPLEDAELTEVETALPMLAYPLKNPALRGILRNPYFLDKALEISWSADRPLPESEREFRALFWRQIVRADQRVSAGTARQREQVFQEIAVRRARALSSHVLCNDFDPEVVATLKHDALINSPDDKPSFAATAHDVLEDWAILHWIEEQNLVEEGSFKSLAAAIGGPPRCSSVIQEVAVGTHRSRPGSCGSTVYGRNCRHRNQCSVPRRHSRVTPEGAVVAGIPGPT